MQNSSPETNILHKEQTPLWKQMTEVVCIQHCSKVNRCKLMVKWSKMMQYFEIIAFINFSFHKTAFYFNFFSPALQEMNFENWVIIPLHSEFHSDFHSDFHFSTIKADLMQKISLTGLPYPSKTAENVEANYNSSTSITNHRLCFNWTHILTP